MKTFSNMATFVSCIIVALLLISQESVAQQRYCGSALTDVLELFCVHGYNLKLADKKRSVILPAYGIDTEAKNSILPSPLESLFMEKMYGEAANLMTKTRRRRHGIYEECCLKGCSLPELSSYCL